jgi:TP901 family phage tail tape measure protein
MPQSIAQLLVEVGADTGGATDALGDLNKGIANFGSVTRQALPASAALAGVGAGVAAGFAKGVSSAGDLQQAVANISTIKPEIDTGDVFSALNAMSTRVPQSASQLGDALYNVFSSIEVTQTDALSLVEKFAKGAVGAQTDAKTFGTSVIGVMNAYGLSVGDADHISDVFFNTVKNGVVTGAELAASLGPVTQSAKSAGVDLDTLGGLIAGVTKEGGPAAQNINNLNNLLAKLNSKEAIKGFNALGVSLTDADGNFRPILDVLTDTKAKLNDLTPAARNAAVLNMFQDFQARQGFTTILSQLDFVKKAVADNTGTAGAAASAYTTMASTFNSQTVLLGNAFGALLTTVGAQLIPALVAATGFVGGLVSGFNALPEPVRTGIAVIIGLLGLLAGIAGVVGLAAAGIGILVPSFVALGAVAGAAIGVLVPLLAIVGGLLVPLALVAAAVALLGVAWVNNWGDIQGKTAEAVTFMTGVLSSLGDFIANTLLPALGTAGSFIRDNVLPFFVALADLGIARLQASIAGLVTFWTTAFLPALKATGDFFNQFVLPPLQALTDFIGSTLKPLLDGLGGLLGPIGQKLQDVFAGVGANAAPNLQAATAAIQAESASTRAAAGVQGGPVTINMGGVKVTNEADENRLVDKIAALLDSAENRVVPPQPILGAGAF